MLIYYTIHVFESHIACLKTACWKSKCLNSPIVGYLIEIIQCHTNFHYRPSICIPRAGQDSPAGTLNECSNFEESMKLCRNVEYDHLHYFSYSAIRNLIRHAIYSKLKKCEIKDLDPDDVIGFSGGKVYYCNFRCIENFNVFAAINVVKQVYTLFNKTLGPVSFVFILFTIKFTLITD